MGKRIILWALGVVIAFSAQAKDSDGIYTRIPLVKDRNGNYVVTVETSAGPARFLFDTGMPHLTLSESLARAISAAHDGARDLYDYTNRKLPAKTAVVDSLRLGTVLFRNVKADVLSDSLAWHRCQGYDGFIGGTMLQGLVVSVSPGDSCIVLTDDIRKLGELPRKNSIPFLRAGGGGVVVRLTAVCGKRKSSHWACIDTGSAGYACRDDLFSGLEADGVLECLESARGIESAIGMVEGDKIEKTYRRAVVPTLILAGAKMKDVPIKSSFGGISTIGRDILEQGRMIIDYPRRKFYFIPYREPETVFHPVFSNIQWRYDTGRVVIASVWDENIKGICPGDRVVSIGGISCEKISLCDYLNMQVQDRAILEIVTHDGGRRTIVVKTAPAK